MNYVRLMAINMKLRVAKSFSPSIASQTGYWNRYGRPSGFSNAVKVLITGYENSSVIFLNLPIVSPHSFT